MGYDLHITRADEWSDNEDRQIPAAEWLALVEADPELTLAGYNGNYFALWSGQSRSPEPWLDWWSGNIYTKNPDAALIAKMVAIAPRFGARVQGDDLEVYLPDGEIEVDGKRQAGPDSDWRKY